MMAEYRILTLSEFVKVEINQRGCSPPFLAKLPH
jgi:hypothetical protein